MKAIILVTQKSELLKRVNKRKEIEPLFSNQNQYNSKFWNDIFLETNMLKLYNSWCDELELKDINYILLDSSTPDYKAIKNREELANIFEKS